MNDQMTYCHSCGMPTEGARYCAYCSDETGTLKPREAVREGIAQWLASWAPDRNADFAKRAEAYMSAMPAWASE